MRGGSFGRSSDLAALILLLLTLAVLNAAVIYTGSGLALDAIMLVVGLLVGTGVSEIGVRYFGRRLAVAIGLGVAGVAVGVAYLLLTGQDGAEYGEPARLLLGLAVGLINGAATIFRREPSPEELERRREQARRSRPALIIVGGIALLLTAAAFADAYLRGV